MYVVNPQAMETLVRVTLRRTDTMSNPIRGELKSPSSSMTWTTSTLKTYILPHQRKTRLPSTTERSRETRHLRVISQQPQLQQIESRRGENRLHRHRYHPSTTMKIIRWWSDHLNRSDTNRWTGTTIGRTNPSQQISTTTAVTSTFPKKIPPRNVHSSICLRYGTLS